MDSLKHQWRSKHSAPTKALRARRGCHQQLGTCQNPALSRMALHQLSTGRYHKHCQCRAAGRSLKRPIFLLPDVIWASLGTVNLAMPSSSTWHSAIRGTGWGETESARALVWAQVHKELCPILNMCETGPMVCNLAYVSLCFSPVWILYLHILFSTHTHFQTDNIVLSFTLLFFLFKLAIQNSFSFIKQKLCSTEFLYTHNQFPLVLTFHINISDSFVESVTIYKPYQISTINILY